METEIENLLKIEADSREFSYLLDDLTLDFNLINQQLQKIDKNLNDIENCCKLKRLLDPIIDDTRKILIEKEKFIQSLEKYSKWTTQDCKNEISNCWNDFYDDPEDSFTLTGLLKLTSILEFSLSNVYYTSTKKQPPHLLKCLLEELTACNFFEENQIFLLQILLGTSKGVNLRNLAWHGFVESVDCAYVSFLFVIFVTYGKTLKDREIITESRDEIKIPLILSTSVLNYDDLLDSDTIQNPQCHPEAFESILNFYYEKRFKSGIFLLLSQIENVLRFIFGEVNHIDTTPRLNKYYVIMDSIFYGYILSDDYTPLVIGKITKVQEMEIRKNNRKNGMLELFPRFIYLMHYDLFYAADGSRVRDKISHGELKIGDDDSEAIMKALLQFILFVVNFYDKKVVPENFHYESCFMSSLKFVKEFNGSIDELRKTFQSLEIPEVFKKDEMKFETTSSIKIDGESVKIIFRPIIENQTVKLMLKIHENLNKSLVNFSYSCNELFDLHNQRKLSTSRREVLSNLIKSLPTFFKGYKSLLTLNHKIFFAIQNLDDKFDNEVWSNKVVKLLKQSLQLTENYQKNFSFETRNFHVADKKTCEFLELIDSNQYLFEEEYMRIIMVIQ